MASDLTDQIEKLVASLERHWGTFRGAAVACAICLLLAISIFEELQSRLLAFAVLAVLQLTAWSNARWQWWARWKKGKLRFLIGVYCDDVSIEAEVEEDFTRELRGLIRQGRLAEGVQIIKATPAECREAETDADIASLFRRKRAQIFVVGRIRRRKDGGGEALFIQLRVMVAHRQLEDRIQEEFAQEISSVFPSGIIKIPVSEQLPQLKMTADWVAISTRYILSIASGASGDLDYAESMLSDALAMLPALPAGIDKRTKINARIADRLIEVQTAKALRAFFAWRQDKSPERAEAARLQAREVLKAKPDYAPMKHMLAILNFILTADAVAAERELNSAKFDHPAVFASMAFAFAMQGKYAQARRAYSNAWKRNPDDDLIAQVESFCRWFKKAYPQFTDQVTWCEVQVMVRTGADSVAMRRRIEYLVHAGFADEVERSLLKNYLPN